MDVEELRAWLTEHGEDLFEFSEYEPEIMDDDELRTTLRYWFGDEDWDDGRFRFESVGKDSSGSQFVALFGASEHPAVAFFGSEGGHGVLTKSLQDFAKALAHGAFADEYHDFDASRSALSVTTNYMLDPTDSDYDSAKAALERYREAAETEFDDIGDFEDLTDGLEELNAAFCGWVQGQGS